MNPPREGIDFGETRIVYAIRCSERRKTIGITVTADGNVEVMAPNGVSRNRISQAVREKAGWIVRKLKENRQYAKAAPLALVSGESIRYLGRQYRLKLIRGAAREIQLKFSGNRAELRLPQDWSEKKRATAAKDTLEGWYRDRLEELIVPIANRYANMVDEKFSGVRIRNLGHRWGSCGSGRVLYFNWQLAMASKPLIEFVAAHEVCHLKHRNHSAEFFRLLSRIQPDWETRRGNLDRQGALSAW